VVDLGEILGSPGIVQWPFVASDCRRGEECGDENVGKPWENHGKMAIYMEKSSIFHGYPLVNSHITMENHYFLWVNPRTKSPCSIATLNYQRVYGDSGINLAYSIWMEYNMEILFIWIEYNMEI